MNTAVVKRPVAAPHTVGRVTFEDVLAMDPDEPGELVEGQWLPMTHPTWRHGLIMSRVSYILTAWAHAHPGWLVASGNSGNRLQRNPDTLRGADVAVLRAERFPTGRSVDGWVQGAPDVPVEILSDAQSVAELLRKAADYLAAGAQMVWVLDPDTGRVSVVTPPGSKRTPNSPAVGFSPASPARWTGSSNSSREEGTDCRPRAPHPAEGGASQEK